MTPSQRVDLYIPAWVEVIRANHWRMQEGRLVCNAQANRTLSEVHDQVWNVAEQFAHKNHRAVVPEDLRYACTWVATAGAATSSKKLTSDQLNRVLDVFGVLVKPEDLDTMLDWTSPVRRQKRSRIAWLQKLAPPNALREICRNTFQTSDLESLTPPQLDRLIVICRDRRLSHYPQNRRPAQGFSNSPVKPPQIRQPDPDNEPF